MITSSDDKMKWNTINDSGRQDETDNIHYVVGHQTGYIQLGGHGGMEEDEDGGRVGSAIVTGLIVNHSSTECSGINQQYG